jgi:hypothetical protein
MVHLHALRFAEGLGDVHHHRVSGPRVAVAGDGIAIAVQLGLAVLPVGFEDGAKGQKRERREERDRRDAAERRGRATRSDVSHGNSIARSRPCPASSPLRVGPPGVCSMVESGAAGPGYRAGVRTSEEGR